MGCNMFNDQEKDLIVMALIYFRNDCSVEDVKELGFDINDNGVDRCEAMAQTLIEDFIGPTWDEEATAEALSSHQLRLFRETEE